MKIYQWELSSLKEQGTNSLFFILMILAAVY